MILEITTHVENAKSKLLTQYKTKPKIEALIAAFAEQIQSIETAGFDLRSDTALDTSIGNQLDRLGAVLNEAREGSLDAEYRIRLIAKIGQNTSTGTSEAIISIYRLLMQATSVQVTEWQPARFSLMAIGVTPVTNVAAIKESIRRAKPVGVAFDLGTVSGTPFVFEGDPHPGGAGFSLEGSPTVGGNLAIQL